MVESSWVRILTPYTGCHDIFTLICCKNCIVCLKKTKINEKEARVGPFKKTFFGGGVKRGIILTNLTR